MQILLSAAVAAVAVFHTLSVQRPTTRSESVLVRFVFDGDTIDVATVGRVRLLGIDAPEIGRGLDTPAPFGREARARLSALVLHRWVRLEYEGATTDAYHRRLAYVMTEDGQFVNAVLVSEGLARVSARTPLARLRELRRAEANAQASRRGMWGSAPPTRRPGYTRGSEASRLPRHPRPIEHAVGHPAGQHANRCCERDSCRVRLRAQDPRAQQAVLPVQPLADLDLRVLHRARPAHL